MLRGHAIRSRCLRDIYARPIKSNFLATAADSSDGSSKRRPGLGGLEGLDVMQDGPQSTKRVTIDAIGNESFTINGLRIRGSVMLFRYFTTIWNVTSADDITPGAFSLPKLLLPRPDIMLIGMGRTAKPLPKDLISFFSSLEISVDVMDTTNACHTFNVLNQEGRNVAAGLLPPDAD